MAVALAPPALASASATLSRSACPAGVSGTCLYYTGTGAEFDAYDYTADVSFVYLTPVRLNDAPTAALGASITPAAGCSAGPAAGSAKCPLPITGIVIDAGGGDDWLAKHLNCAGCGRVFADMGGGDDVLRATNNGDLLRGNDGNDSLTALGGNDVLAGGTGDDLLDPGNGADDVAGGAGYDRVVFVKAAGEPVSITLDDVANDGQAGEGDGKDTLLGNDQANVLRGNPGDDLVEGGGGSDSLFGEAGNDTIKARDGLVDTIDCGPATDAATVDTIDVLSNCETVDASSALEPDADHDAIAKPLDCDDANAAVKPGAVDVPDNGVDEDCSGSDAIDLDRDRDGFNRPQDCNDGDPRIHPGALDVPGNRVDEDCSGKAADYPLLGSVMRTGIQIVNRAVVFRRFYVANARAGSWLSLRCSGRGCTFSRKRLTVSRSRARMDLRRNIRGLRLHRGAWLEVRITKSQTIGSVTRWTMGKTTHVRKERCLRPGAATPGACPV
jgi:Ca2+-binding RTX toxin-like protein